MADIVSEKSLDVSYVIFCERNFSPLFLWARQSDGLSLTPVEVSQNWTVFS